MNPPDVTIIVVPRERFSGTRRSLESIYNHTLIPFNLVYVDGGSPSSVKRYLEKQAAQHGFDLRRTAHYLSPNEARNIGTQGCETKYMVFVDNDVVVQKGWLKNMLACAEETKAWIVGPTYLIGEPHKETIHMTGGNAGLKNIQGKRHFYEQHANANKQLSLVKDQLKRSECDFVEFHCMLIRTDVFKKIGPLDEALLSASEHIDICLQTKKAGGSVFYEPTSIITYITPKVLIRFSDLRFFLRRWSDEWNKSSLFYFKKKYDLNDDDNFLKEHYRWLTNHRRWPLRLLIRGTRKIFGHKAGHTVAKSIVDPVLFALTPKDRPRTLETGDIADI